MDKKLQSTICHRDIPADPKTPEMARALHSCIQQLLSSPEIMAEFQAWREQYHATQSGRAKEIQP